MQSRPLAPGYATPVYPTHNPAVSRPDNRPTSALAIISLVLSIIGWTPLSVVLGHLARRRIARFGLRGNGIALAALIIGYLLLPIVIIWWSAVIYSLASYPR